MERIKTLRLQGATKRGVVRHLLIAGVVTLGLGTVMASTVSPSTDSGEVAPLRLPIATVMAGDDDSRPALSHQDPTAYLAEGARRARNSPDLRDFLLDTAIQLRDIRPEHPSRWHPHGVD